jgi:hypothetical protein
VKNKTVPQTRVLYDAVFEAGKSLADRPTDRRRIIFIVSDAQVSGTSTQAHNLKDTTEYLLRNNIELYAVTTDFGAFEGKYSVLNAFADATGGDVYKKLSTDSMEKASTRSQEAQAPVRARLSSTQTLKVRLPTFREVEVKAGSN